MRRFVLAVWVSTFLLLPALAYAGNPWEELMGRKPRTWSDPGGRFSIDLPVGWTASATSESDPVQISRVHPDYGQRAVVTVEIRALPPGVKLTHFGIRVAEEVGRAAKNIQLVDEDRLEVSGSPAVRRLFTHQEAGNAERMNEVVQVILVAGDRGVVITLETAAGARGIFWEDFELMTKGFVLSGGAGAPVLRDQGTGRRRVRAGEMVNPERVPY